MSDSLTTTLEHNKMRIALMQAGTLLLLSVLLHWRVHYYVFDVASSVPDAAHAFAVPVLVLILAWLRRHDLVQRISRGSIWGVVIIALGILMYGISNWPFRYGYPDKVSSVIVVAGIIMVTCGWRFLYRCLPLLFLILIAIPTGSRAFARLIITPETLTLEVVRAVLDLLPGITITLEGQDIYYLGDHGTGVIALAEPHHGARLLLAYLTVCVFMAFVRIRPLWQIITLGILSIPVVLFCNFVRVALWGIITIYWNIDPLSGVPRTLSAILALCLSYIIFGVLIILIRSLVIERNGTENNCASEYCAGE